MQVPRSMRLESNDAMPEDHAGEAMASRLGVT
jgi:hypothetical protein